MATITVEFQYGQYPEAIFRVEKQYNGTWYKYMMNDTFPTGQPLVLGSNAGDWVSSSYYTLAEDGGQVSNLLNYRFTFMLPWTSDTQTIVINEYDGQTSYSSYVSYPFYADVSLTVELAPSGPIEAPAGAHSFEFNFTDTSAGQPSKVFLLVQGTDGNYYGSPEIGEWGEIKLLGNDFVNGFTIPSPSAEWTRWDDAQGINVQKPANVNFTHNFMIDVLDSQWMFLYQGIGDISGGTLEMKKFVTWGPNGPVTESNGSSVILQGISPFTGQALGLPLLWI